MQKSGSNEHSQNDRAGGDVPINRSPSDARTWDGGRSPGAGGHARPVTEGKVALLTKPRTSGQIVAIIPENVEEAFRLAQAVHKSGMAPKDLNSAEKINVAILTGLELGLPPMQALNRIAVINNRPSLWGDAVPALLLSKGFRLKETITGEGDKRTATCTVRRPDGDEITRTFSVVDAKQAGLWSKPGPWKQYPDRMLQMRARGFAARDGAADVLAGLYLREEIEDEIATAPKSAYRARKDGDYERQIGRAHV